VTMATHCATQALRDLYGDIAEKRESRENALMFSARLPDVGRTTEQVRDDIEEALTRDAGCNAVMFQVAVASVSYEGSTVTRDGTEKAARCFFIDVRPWIIILE
jgi:hypothetical protein